MRHFLTSLFLFCLTIGGLSGTQAGIITITFDDGITETKPEESSFLRFNGGRMDTENYFLNLNGNDKPIKTWVGATYAGFVFDHFGITRSSNPASSYYIGAVDGSNVGYNDNGTTAYISRPNETFTFQGGFFTPANYLSGVVITDTVWMAYSCTPSSGRFHPK